VRKRAKRRRREGGRTYLSGSRWRRRLRAAHRGAGQHDPSLWNVAPWPTRERERRERRTVLAEDARRVDGPRLVEADVLALHDAAHVGEGALVEAGARVAAEVGRQVEVRGREACAERKRGRGSAELSRRGTRARSRKGEVPHLALLRPQRWSRGRSSAGGTRRSAGGGRRRGGGSATRGRRRGGRRRGVGASSGESTWREGGAVGRVRGW